MFFLRFIEFKRISSLKIIKKPWVFWYFKWKKKIIVDTIEALTILKTRKNAYEVIFFDK